MSLNKLPNELIAHISSFLKFDDNLQFIFSQKRIYNVIKRDGLDKPECNTLTFTEGYYHFTGAYFINDNIDFPLVKQNQKYHSIHGEIISKFGNIDDIDFHSGIPLGDDILKDMLKSKVKIRELKLGYVDINVENVDLFIAVCKKFDSIVLEEAEVMKKYYYDKVIIAMLPKTLFKMEVSYDELELIDGYGLTDQTLEALSSRRMIHEWFLINRVFTSFTVNGIKSLIEKIVDLLPSSLRLYLGILKFEEKWNARRWIENIDSNLDSPYTMRRCFDGFHPADMIHYYVFLKPRIGFAHRSVICFAINRVAV